MDRIKLLVVEADHEAAKTIQACFSPSDYACAIANSAEEAFELIDDVDFRAIVCAMRLPASAGLEVLRRGLSRNPQTAIIMTCSPSDWQAAIEAMRMGAYDCLRKPFQCEELLLSVERAFERQRIKSEREIFQALFDTAVHERTEHLHHVLEHVGEIQQSTLDMLIAGLEGREQPTNLHSLRVRSFALLLAKKCGYNHDLMQQLGDGSLLHDIGKVAIPDAILMKPGKLTPEEFQVVQQHSMFGYQVLSRVPRFQHAAMLALFHHERFDGEGYPLRIRGNSIPLSARIFALADTLDAVTAGRTYCPARSMEEARVEIRRCSGTQFDPDITDVFLSVSDEEWLSTRESVSKLYSNIPPFYSLPARAPTSVSADPFLKRAHS